MPPKNPFKAKTPNLYMHSSTQNSPGHATSPNSRLRANRTAHACMSMSLRSSLTSESHSALTPHTGSTRTGVDMYLSIISAFIQGGPSLALQGGPPSGSEPNSQAEQHEQIAASPTASTRSFESRHCDPGLSRAGNCDVRAEHCEPSIASRALGTALRAERCERSIASRALRVEHCEPRQ